MFAVVLARALGTTTCHPHMSTSLIPPFVMSDRKSQSNAAAAALLGRFTVASAFYVVVVVVIVCPVSFLFVPVRRAMILRVGLANRMPL